MDPSEAALILQKHGEAKTPIKRVLAMQERRVAVYRDFEAALKRALEARDPALYATGCEQVTTEFDSISKAINQAETELQGAAAKAVRALQLAEKDKLELTAASHLAAFRRDPDPSIDHLNSSLVDVVTRINDAIDELKAALVDAPD